MPRAPAKGKASSSSPAAAIDAQLKRYREMRDFSTTAEPRGDSKETRGGDKSKPRGSKPAASPDAGLPFVIQKHAATRLHYDFRLGWHGVLKSWAVAKGPSYVVADKRLAVQVEDHPMEYGGFEGTIPKGQYGGGTVMLWDTGTWEPVGDADEGLRTGRLKFILHGQKLKGHWTLVRMGGRAAQESKPNWLLIKEHDEYERAADAPAIVDEAPDSVVTHRDLAAIGEQSDHVWDSRTGLAADERAKQAKPAAGQTKAAAKNKVRPRPVPLPEQITATREPLPDFIPPQLASLAEKPPKGDGWLHELKLDGYRMQARLDGKRAQLLTRSGLDWTHRMPALAAALRQLPVKSALLDGEVIVLDQDGLSSFAALQAAFQQGSAHELLYYLFDLLHLDGHSLRQMPLSDRKQLLEKLLSTFTESPLRLSQDIRHDGATFFKEACRMGAEGVVSKRADAAYLSGRSASWVKAKCGHRQELVIGGFTLPSNGSDGLGALLLGYYQGSALHYAGRAGTGFTQQSQLQIRKRLEDIRVDANPFVKIDPANARGARWVKPQLVAEIAFSTWTADKLVRQASFKGLRDDKPAAEVVLEHPKSAATATEDAAKAGDTAKPANTTKPGAPSYAKRRVGPKNSISPASTRPTRLTHPDKIVDPQSGLTKQKLYDYYQAIGEHILPFIADRPLSIVRCPGGTAAKCFFQKHVKDGLPKDISSVMIADKKGGPPEPYITLSKAEVLTELAQLNVLELHPWGATAADFEHPDRIIFDLDPDASISWQTLAATAADVRTRMKQLGLESFLKSTGGKGLHIVAPIAAEHDWTTVKEFAHNFVLAMEAADPRLYITKMTKAARTNRIYLDYLRNERGATAVAPYSPRSRAGVPVSVTMAWSELKADAPPRCAVADFDAWKGRLRRDPWAKLPSLKQRLTHDAIAAVAEKSARKK